MCACWSMLTSACFRCDGSTQPQQLQGDNENHSMLHMNWFTGTWCSTTWVSHSMAACQPVMTLGSSRPVGLLMASSFYPGGWLFRMLRAPAHSLPAAQRAAPS